MELYLDDMFNILEDTPDKSIDFIYCDLPYNETACKFDKDVIDLDKLWFHYKRIAKNDETPFMFSCSVKFGNKLINSNPKWFRFEYLWIKSSPTGFLNAKKMPMRKSEMVYVFYKKLPSVYGENLNLHHTHKFLKETPTKRAGKDGVDNSKMIKNRSSSGKEISYKYDPPLPNNVVVEETCKYDVDKNVYGGGKKDRIKISKNKEDHMTKYDPPLPNNIIMEGENGNAWNTEKRNKPIVRVKADQYDKKLPTNVISEVNYDKSFNSDMYGDVKRDDRKNKIIYNPQLPNNVIQEGQTLGDKNNECYGDFSYYNNGVMGYEPKLPTNVQEETENIKTIKRTDKGCKSLYGEETGKIFIYDEKGKLRNSEPRYNPPLPTNVLEIKSEKKLHPTQKPVALIEFLLKYYSRENDLCLDVCMGSGTTGVACLNMNRRFIGIEKDEKFFSIAMERLEKHPNYKSTTSS